jgi:hypothetical protein
MVGLAQGEASHSAWVLGRLQEAGSVQVQEVELARARVVRQPARLRSRVSHTYRKSYFPLPAGPRSWCRLLQRRARVQGLALREEVWARLPAGVAREPPGPSPRRSYRKRPHPASLALRTQNSWWLLPWERAVPEVLQEAGLVQVPGSPTSLHTRHRKQRHQVVVNHNSDMQA